MQLSIRQMLKAMAANDVAYDGKFYVGVHSTGIYCLPSCKAKLPLPKNVSFYPNREEAITDGLRGCKRCRSEKYPDVLPEWLHSVLAYMRKYRNERLNEERLMEMTGVNISTVRRYFNTHLHLTPLAFHRKLRLSFAKELIEQGADYLSAAYECGYESASGFRDAFKQQFGKPPGKLHEKK